MDDESQIAQSNRDNDNDVNKKFLPFSKSYNSLNNLTDWRSSNEYRSFMSCFAQLSFCDYNFKTISLRLREFGDIGTVNNYQINNWI